MNRLKLMTLVTLVALVFGFASCDPIGKTTYNYSTYQDAVNNTVMSGKKHDKVILLVAFGSTWQQAFDAFD